MITADGCPAGSSPAYGRSGVIRRQVLRRDHRICGTGAQLIVTAIVKEYWRCTT